MITIMDGIRIANEFANGFEDFKSEIGAEAMTRRSRHCRLMCEEEAPLLATVGERLARRGGLGCEGVGFDQGDEELLATAKLG
ncbi:uncharacterized protein A4U43_C10F15260 [Asparagus officinalis]|uniref:Uncharacterized protein n=1 Tax=Asparagus officinalis TaxID=4686 RepID=A0A5P1E6A1_ASPOF|nr:uncharacterized protein A4U43_C10F15260 [Asparagus officinalis]